MGLNMHFEKTLSEAPSKSEALKLFSLSTVLEAAATEDGAVCGVIEGKISPTLIFRVQELIGDTIGLVDEAKAENDEALAVFFEEVVPATQPPIGKLLYQ